MLEWNGSKWMVKIHISNLTSFELRCNSNCSSCYELHICIDFFTLFLPVCIFDWCQLESNLRPLALTPDWLKHVDSLAKMGSGHHIIINSSRVRHGIGKKKARHLEPEVNPSSNAGSGLSLFWWRGGRLSRRLFNWKLLPQSLARKAARQGGFSFCFQMQLPFLVNWTVELHLARFLFLVSHLPRIVMCRWM